MAGAAASTAVFPEVFASTAQQAQVMLRPGSGAGGFEFAALAGGGATLNVSVSAGVVGSAVLYGRHFGADTLPYSC